MAALEISNNLPIPICSLKVEVILLWCYGLNVAENPIVLDKYPFPFYLPHDAFCTYSSKCHEISHVPAEILKTFLKMTVVLMFILRQRIEMTLLAFSKFSRSSIPGWSLYSSVSHLYIIIRVQLR